MEKMRRTDAAQNRWFSTGFMSGGVGGVDAERHTLKDAVMIRPGEALGHGFWIDDAFCSDIAARCSAAQDKGLKARFGHPNMCSDALGTFLGRWKGGRLDAEKRVLADLHLSSTSAESPKGDLRKYVEEMAAKEPGHFGASIVFEIDREAVWSECIANGAKEKEDDYGTWLDLSSFKSPDPRNVKNLPHARCAKLHAADLVDDPAATDGMFSGAAGMSLAASMTEWLDTHPGVLKAMNDEPELLNIVERYADELKPFLARYTANLEKKLQSTTQAAEPAAPAPETKPAESDELKAKLTASEAQAEADKKQIARLQAELAVADESCNTNAAEIKRLATELDTAKAALKSATDERDEARKKLAAFESGQPPVSATPVVDSKPKGSLMERARGKK